MYFTRVQFHYLPVPTRALALLRIRLESEDDQIFLLRTALEVSSSFIMNRRRSGCTTCSVPHSEGLYFSRAMPQSCISCIMRSYNEAESDSEVLCITDRVNVTSVKQKLSSNLRAIVVSNTVTFNRQQWKILLRELENSSELVAIDTIAIYSKNSSCTSSSSALVHQRLIADFVSSLVVVVETNSLTSTLWVNEGAFMELDVLLKLVGVFAVTGAAHFDDDDDGHQQQHRIRKKRVLFANFDRDAHRLLQASNFYDNCYDNKQNNNQNITLIIVFENMEIDRQMLKLETTNTNNYRNSKKEVIFDHCTLVVDLSWAIRRLRSFCETLVLVFCDTVVPSSRIEKRHEQQQYAGTNNNVIFVNSHSSGGTLSRGPDEDSNYEADCSCEERC
eukprot:PhM_4_TR9517/c0_g1_i1/m.98346